MPISKEIYQSVQEIYQQADREVQQAGPVCAASGRCCRFEEFDHVLFLTSLEADVLLSDSTGYSKPVSSSRCPFQVDNLCTARNSRPLGCRVYFCDPDYQETGNQITEKYLRQLKALAASVDSDWQYAPLHYFLNSRESTTVQQTAAGTVSSKVSDRIELPLAK